MDQNVGGLRREAEKITVAGWGLVGEAGCVVFVEAEKGVGWVQAEITEIKEPSGPSTFHSRKAFGNSLKFNLPSAPNQESVRELE